MNALAFLRPELLWGLLAAGLPVIIHLINRHRARRHRFAAIDFLFRVQRKSARRILLKQLLLLLIRTLLIAALVLAAAGPVLRPAGVTAQAGPTTSCLILDASLSMRTREGDRNLFELARERARDLVRSLGPGDKACLLVAGQQVRALVEPCTASPAPLLDALDGLEAEYGTSDLAAAMERAASLVNAEPGSNRRLVLLTDGAAHAVGRAPVWPAGSLPPKVELHDPAPDRTRSNHAITRVSQAAAGNLLELSAGLIHHGPDPVTDLPAEVWLGGEPVLRGFVSLESDEPISKVFSLRPPEGGPQPGLIKIRPDALAEDDQRGFYAAGRRLLQVLLVNGDMRPVLLRDELYFLEHALSPAGPKTAGIRFTSVTPDRLDAGLLDSAQVVFLANVRALGEQAVDRLREFVASGGGLFVAMGDKVDIERANQMLADLIPWRLRDVVSLGPADADGEHRRGLAFGDVDATHPALAIFAGGGHEPLTAVRTRRAVVLEPGRAEGEARVLIHYANGAPALVEGRRGAGRVLLFTSSLDLDWTSWPSRASYLPFLQHAVAYLAGTLDERPPPEVEVGAEIRLPIIEQADRLLVRPPTGEPAELRARSADDREAVFTQTVRPGWYQVEQRAGPRVLAQGPLPGFFVRPPASESDPTPLEEDRLRGLLGQQAQLVMAGSAADGSRSRAGLLLMLALALALCEAFLVRR